MRWRDRSNILHDERGQITLMLAVALTVLLLFMALSVDVGLAYVTKAKLSKAVDAACLTAMRNLAQGQTTAGNLAVNSFNANYSTSGLDAVAPSVTVGFAKDSYGNTLVNVSATASVRTFFMRLLPQFQTFSVSDSAQATRGKLVMAIILDRSGSMGSDGGGSALQSAVPSFVNDFDNANDEVTLVSFSSNSSVNFQIATNFQTPISNAVKAMVFGGGTFGTGGNYIASVGPPLTLADNQIGSVPITTGQNTIRVVVYFTDGLMNMLQDSFDCPASTTINYGGYDSGSTVDAMDPSTGTDLGSVPTTGTYRGTIPYKSGPSYCKNQQGVNVTTFYSQQYGTEESFTRANVTAESQYRALQTATAMRSENPGTYIYTIGLGSGVSTTTQTFLKQLANDPTGTSYNPNLPEGMFLYVPDCPSTTCTAELQTAFQTIASKILLRLTQ